MDGNQRRKLEKEKQRRAKAQALADKQAAVEKSRLEKEARNEALLAERAKVDEARSAAAAERARLEDEKVRAAAKKNAQEKQKATALAEKKKLQQIQNKIYLFYLSKLYFDIFQNQQLTHSLYYVSCILNMFQFEN